MGQTYLLLPFVIMTGQIQIHSLTSPQISHRYHNSLFKSISNVTFFQRAVVSISEWSSIYNLPRSLLSCKEFLSVSHSEFLPESLQ